MNGNNHTESTLLVALQKRYSAPEWALLSQVRRTTGYARNIRTADAIAMSLFPSRGLHVFGFEIKTARQDWLKELKDPIKAEEIAQFCDFWYLVTSDKSIVQPGELPAYWGLLCMHGEVLRCDKEATKLTAKEIDRFFMAAIFRRIHETKTDSEEFRAEYQRGRADGKRLEKERLDGDINRLQNAAAELEQVLEGFEKESGIDIRDFKWHGGEKIGKAFKVALGGGRDLKWKIQELERIRNGVDQLLQEHKAAIPADGKVEDLY